MAIEKEEGSFESLLNGKVSLPLQCFLMEPLDVEETIEWKYKTNMIFNSSHYFVERFFKHIHIPFEIRTD